MNELWLHGQQVNEQWTNSLVVLLHKGGSKAQLNNYRGIALMPVLAKVYSNILKDRLVSLVESSSILSQYQAGFRTGRGTTQKLMGIKLLIQDALAKKQPLLMLDIDFYKAFDQVEFWLIRETMEYYGFPQQLIQAITNSFEGATLQYKLAGGTTAKVEQKRGVRQGDPLSAILFAIVINPLLKRLEELHQQEMPQSYCGPHTYADDLTQSATHEATLRRAAEIINEHSRVANLPINVNKCLLLWNEEAKKLWPNLRLQLRSKDGQLFELEPKEPNTPFKILGVYFTMQNSFKHQKDTIRDKFSRLVKLMTKRKYTEFQLAHIYNALQIPTIGYGMIVVDYTLAELDELDTIPASVFRSRLKLQTRNPGTPIRRPHEMGGFGLNSLRTIHAAKKAEAFKVILNGPKCPAQDHLRRIFAERATSYNPITIPEAAMHGISNPLRALKDLEILLSTTIPLAPNKYNILTIRNETFKKSLRNDFGIATDRNSLETLSRKIFQGHPPQLVSLDEMMAIDFSKHTSNKQQLPVDEVARLHALLRNSATPAPKSLINRPTAGKTLIVNNRAPKFLHEGTEYILLGVDGSFDKNKHAAAGAVVVASSGNRLRLQEENANTNSSLGIAVQGKQTNTRAELTALYHACDADTGETHKFIVSDSEQSLESINSFPTLTLKRQLEVDHRDLIRAIRERKQQMADAGVQIHFEHVYSHQNDGTSSSPKRDEKIAEQRAKFSGDYSKLVAVNKRADTLAKETVPSNPFVRDFVKRPSKFLDTFYFTHEGTPLFRNIHQEVKSVSEKLEVENLKTQTMRDKTLKQALDHADMKLSHVAAKAKHYKYHKAGATLLAARMHALPTMRAMSRVHLFYKDDAPKRDYYKTMYPTGRCMYCQELETNEHVFTCSKSPHRSDEARKLWQDIYAHLRQEGVVNPEALHPFTLIPKGNVFQLKTPKNSQKALQCVNSFSKNHAELAAFGYIPKEFSRALTELGLEKDKRKSVKEYIALRIAEAFRKTFARRRQAYAFVQDQRALYRKHILGINHGPGPPAPMDEDTDDTDVPEQELEQELRQAQPDGEPRHVLLQPDPTQQPQEEEDFLQLEPMD